VLADRSPPISTRSIHPANIIGFIFDTFFKYLHDRNN
jgi:hypothetical protein